MLLGFVLIEGVKVIDSECTTILHGTEAGLCNVKRQFSEEARVETGKRLTEETVISWQLSKSVANLGLKTSIEVSYPHSKKRCDLVIRSEDNKSVWIELKLASKTWLNCKGRTTGTSSSYKGYLFGDDSHPGTAHDFAKLEGLTGRYASRLGMLLIGFDSLQNRMDDDVVKLAVQERLADRGWTLSRQDSWLDRRDERFGINCWFWSREAL